MPNPALEQFIQSNELLDSIFKRAEQDGVNPDYDLILDVLCSYKDINKPLSRIAIFGELAQCESQSARGITFAILGCLKANKTHPIVSLKYVKKFTENSTTLSGQLNNAIKQVIGQFNVLSILSPKELQNCAQLIQEFALIISKKIKTDDLNNYFTACKSILSITHPVAGKYFAVEFLKNMCEQCPNEVRIFFADGREHLSKYLSDELLNKVFFAEKPAEKPIDKPAENLEMLFDANTIEFINMLISENDRDNLQQLLANQDCKNKFIPPEQIDMLCDALNRVQYPFLLKPLIELLLVATDKLISGEKLVKEAFLKGLLTSQFKPITPILDNELAKKILRGQNLLEAQPYQTDGNSPNQYQFSS